MKVKILAFGLLGVGALIIGLGTFNYYAQLSHKDNATCQLKEMEAVVLDGGDGVAVITITQTYFCLFPENEAVVAKMMMETLAGWKNKRPAKIVSSLVASVSKKGFPVWTLTYTVQKRAED